MDNWKRLTQRCCYNINEHMLALMRVYMTLEMFVLNLVLFSIVTYSEAVFLGAVFCIIAHGSKPFQVHTLVHYCDRAQV